MPGSSSRIRDAAHARFQTTRWSMVAAAGTAEPQARQALEELCAAYWFPIYAHVRRSGRDVPTAQDLTQSFFARLLEKQVLPQADRTRGRFRTFLLVSLENFLRNDYEREHALKRGGGHSRVPLDFTLAESRYGAEPHHAPTAERAFERQWALTVLEQALAELQRQHQASGKERLFETLVGFLTPGDNPGACEQAAAELEMTPAAVRMAASRLRKQYRALIRAEIARTVSDPADVEAELASLFAALGS